MQQVRDRKVTFNVTEPVEIEPGTVLQPGTYSGTEKQIGISTLAGVSWTKPMYRLELSADDLENMGLNSRNLISIEYDVSKLVSLGKISID